MIRRVIYIPMEYDDKGEPTVPDWNYEGDSTPMAAATEEWEHRRMLCDSGSIVVAKVEETTDLPTADEFENIRAACEGEFVPGDEWRRWVACIEVRITTREIPKPV
ncbi:MAG TPA: hypothetical protein DCS97_06850 [Planctomycetes bacterium]|nr:hypothetical protein [Planctomycetota bacterium]